VVRSFIALALLALFVGPVAGVAHSQAGILDPAQLMLTVSEMPAGFSQSGADTVQSGPGYSMAIRSFNDSDSNVQLFAISTSDSTIAEAQATGLLGSLGSQGVVFPMDEANVVLDIGEGAVIGWSTPDANSVMFSAAVFKAGSFAGAVVWTHPEDDEDDTELIDMARKMANKARTAR
jgi:hypothetical protein